MVQKNTQTENKLSLDKAYEGQSDALVEISDLLADLTACIKALTDKQFELTTRIVQLERKSE